MHPGKTSSTTSRIATRNPRTFKAPPHSLELRLHVQLGERRCCLPRRNSGLQSLAAAMKSPLAQKFRASRKVINPRLQVPKNFVRNVENPRVTMCLFRNQRPLHVLASMDFPVRKVASPVCRAPDCRVARLSRASAWQGRQEHPIRRIRGGCSALRQVDA